MARYIDADILIERLKFKRDETDKGKKKYSGLECAISQVQKQQTADVVEVKQGKWEKKTFIIFDSEKVGYKCSECNTTWDTSTNYCPNCGAKMDGERKCDNDRM